MAGVQLVRLNQLNVNIKNAVIVGIIIAKSPVRTFNGRGRNSKPEDETRGVTAFTLRDSDVDAINCDVWGSEYFVCTFYERFSVGDTVEITSPKICVKQGDRNEIYKPNVSSPYYLSLNEGHSDACIHTGEWVSSLLRLLHVPTKPASGYHGLADLMKITEPNQNTFVDLLVVVKTVGPVKDIKTKSGACMRVRNVELLDNTTPATVQLEIYDSDTIQRASEWAPMESVLFIADARVTWRWRACGVSVSSRTVVTHQPHTPAAEALRLHAHNLPNARAASGPAAWAAWGAEGAGAASVAQARDRLRAQPPAHFTLTLHAVLTRLDLDALRATFAGDAASSGPSAAAGYAGAGELSVRLADHTGEIGARMDPRALEEPLRHTVEQMAAMSAEELGALRWRVLLERCCARVASSGYPPRLLVLALRLATSQDAIPLY